MHYLLNKNNNKNSFIAATIFTLAIITTSSMASTPIASATTATATTTTTTTTSPEEGIDLSPQPVLQERTRAVSENLINETHVQTGFTGNGTLNLPNGTETINTNLSGSLLISLMEGTATGKEVITTEDGSESATAKLFGIARFNMEEDTGRGIVLAVIHTNSTTGMLAPFDGMILVGQSEFDPEGTTLTTLWEWQSGIPLPTVEGTGGTTTPLTTGGEETTATTPPLDTLGQ